MKGLKYYWVCFFLGCMWGSTSFAVGDLKGMVVDTSHHLLWPDGVIPYVMSESLSLSKQAEILAAMALWEAGTVVRFVKLMPESQLDHLDYVIFQAHAGKTCASSVGREGGVQTLRLAERCSTMMIAHELGHLMGLWHEQSRLDRDLYVEVVWENIREAHYHNFDRRVGDGQNQGPYDYDSIMHYSETAFSKNGKPTIVPQRAGAQIGQRTHLSAGDIASVNALYLNAHHKE
ncbi:MAG: M12 family metallopeptidase [Legionellaceae bacterium]|nr:M12 family metallopeptidase [Legionellaceae bacterium]